jgi:diguanylate cyclase (GGDEF)-like protein/PAS domain S-box-containing protein
MLGQWKGFAFVALSSALVYAVASRPGPAVHREKLPTSVGSLRLWAVLALASAALVAAVVASAVGALRGERAEVAKALGAFAGMKLSAWGAWKQERRTTVDTLLRIEGLAGTQAGAVTPSAGQLGRLCALATQCKQARWVPGDDHGPNAASHPGTGTPVQMAGPVSAWPVAIDLRWPGAGAGTGWLQLQFDGLPALRQLLADPAAFPAFEGMQLALVRDTPSGAQVIDAPNDGPVVLRLIDGPWRGAQAMRAGQAAAGVPTTFDAPWPGATGRDVFGVVAAPSIEGWTLVAHVERRRLYEHAWRDVLWISAVAMAVLIAAGLALLGLHQHRELTAARQLRTGQDERLRALALLDAIADGTPDVIFAKDLAGRFLFANRAACLAVGRPADEVLGQPAGSFFAGEELAAIEALHDQVIATGAVVSSEGALTTAAGRKRYLRTLGPLREASGEIRGVFGVVRDITELRLQEQRSALWAQAFESTRDGMLICDAAGRIECINRAFTEITGYDEQDVIGRAPNVLSSGRHEPAFYRALWREVHENGVWRGEIWNRRKSGEVFPEWLTINAVSDAQGQVLHYVGVFTDISRVKQDEERLHRLANYDPLTGLPNRRLLDERLAHALNHPRSDDELMAVLSIDLDGFKTVNDSLGHPAGDELLLRVAQRLKHRLRPEDTLGRLGGDEFLVIARSLHQPADAAALAQGLLAIIGQPVRLGSGSDAYVTASIGISVCHGAARPDATAMLRDADTALYRAKEEGRNRFCFYCAGMNEQAMAKLDTEAALSQAMQRGQLRLHYQPKVEAASGRLAGAEALLRWQREGRLVPPGQFIPLAESSSLILEIGAWVIDEACRQWRRWADEGLAPPHIAVNVAARQFSSGDLDRVVSRALQRHRVPPGSLELELTESMLIDRPEESIALLRRLKEVGVSLALDDFGTGYSNLAYMRQFPIDTLKIDQSFVALIGEGEDGSAIVDAVVALAHRLQLSVVAEGVETEAQRRHLQAQGCDQLQGYRVGRPMPAADFGALFCTAAPAPGGVEQPAAAEAG